MSTETNTNDSKSTDVTEIFQQDEKVDELSAHEVKDSWVRGKFLNEILLYHDEKGDAGFMGSDHCKKIRDLLENGSPASIQEAALRGLGSDHPTTKALGWENGPGNVETLFDRLTTDDLDDEMLVEWAREKLKKELRNSIWHVDVMRSRVEHHTSEDNEDNAIADRT